MVFIRNKGNYQEIPYLSDNNHLNPYRNMPSYSPRSVLLTEKTGKSEKKVNFYGDLSNVDMKYTKFDANKHDYCKKLVIFS